ncbi:phosphatase [Cellvibrio mixtus]|uniref:Phosphatase n=1 Tax=Cellvibrio mixtus TaxID=39650 RepID=A0A266Q729_9GAMM|nr:phosphatase [Cellvibrio sp. PSBB023]OZY85191.1 phosphatase [Cellvibrio mixtus]
MFDLHSHTYFSDGMLSPEALIARAKERGVSVLAITDHDTIAGVRIAQKAALDAAIQLIPGIEFSSQWGRGGVHIVGLGVDIDSAVLAEAIAHQEDARAARSIAIAERLSKAGFPDALAGARALAGGVSVGRPHFAQYLVAIGAVKNINAAFKKYLGAGKPADVKYQWPLMDQVIAWIHGAGGVAVLAHPAKYELTRTKMCALVDSFVAAGGDAIEVISGLQPSAMTDDLLRITASRNLYASCGSDFHIPDQPWQDLGGFGRLPPQAKAVWELLGYNNINA